MEPWVIATGLIAAYLLFTLIIGVLSHRRMTVDMEDFLLYGRKAGFVVLYLTVVATFHSAFAFLGSGGFFYTHGIGWWDAGTWTILSGATMYVLGTRIWALGKRFGYFTPADLLADFYESEAVRVVAALVSVVFTILYIQVLPLAAAAHENRRPRRDRRRPGDAVRHADGRAAPSRSARRRLVAGRQCARDRRRLPLHGAALRCNGPAHPRHAGAVHLRRRPGRAGAGAFEGCGRCIMSSSIRSGRVVTHAVVDARKT